MPKIHDFDRAMWRNRSTAQQLLDEGEELPLELCRWEGHHGEVAYGYAAEDADGKYQITFNGDVVDLVDSRKAAREGAAELMRKLPPEDWEEIEDFSTLQRAAGALGVYEQGDDGDALREKLSQAEA